MCSFLCFNLSVNDSREQDFILMLELTHPIMRQTILNGVIVHYLRGTHTVDI